MQSEGGEIVELKRPAPAKGKSSELSARTDDPVRMYLREMGSVELSLNAEYAKIWPNITVKKTLPPDFKEREGKPDKLQYFSPNPGAGD
jgi:hypothetical protein